MEIYKIRPADFDANITLTAGRHFSRRMSQDTKDAIAYLVEQGLGNTEIGRTLGVPTAWVSRRKYHLRLQRKLTLPDAGRPDRKFDPAREMWDAGKTIREIAVAYGYTWRRMAGVIEYYRSQFGWFPKKRANRTKKPDKKYEEARRMWDAGKTVREIADFYGKTYDATASLIQYYRREFGWFSPRQ